MNYAFDFCEFRKSLSLFSLSFFCIMDYVRHLQQRFQRERMVCHKGAQLYWPLLLSPVILSMFYHPSELLHSFPFFVPNLFTPQDTDYYHSDLDLTLNNKAPASIGLSSPVEICTIILNKMEWETFLCKLKTSFISKILSVSKHNVARQWVPWQLAG